MAHWLLHSVRRCGTAVRADSALPSAVGVCYSFDSSHSFCGPLLFNHVVSFRCQWTLKLLFVEQQKLMVELTTLHWAAGHGSE